jgi:hypothetical protein
VSRYLIRRIVWAAVLLVAVTFVSFVIFFIVPANPARAMTGPKAPPDQVERVEKMLGLDDPVPVQYARFMKDLVVHQSLGRSFATRQQVNDIIKAAAPVTASLVFGGVVIWLAIAFPIGILSAMRPRTLLDRFAMVFVLIGVSAHPAHLETRFAFRTRMLDYLWAGLPIVSTEGEQTGSEGCLSVGKVPAIVTRPMKARLRAQDVKGEWFEREAEGYAARAFLHETDHCDGIVFIDKTTPLKRELVRRKIRRLEKQGRWI